MQTFPILAFILLLTAAYCIAGNDDKKQPKGPKVTDMVNLMLLLYILMYSVDYQIGSYHCSSQNYSMVQYKALIYVIFVLD